MKKKKTTTKHRITEVESLGLSRPLFKGWGPAHDFTEPQPSWAGPLIMGGDPISGGALNRKIFDRTGLTKIWLNFGGRQEVGSSKSPFLTEFLPLGWITKAARHSGFKMTPEISKKYLEILLFWLKFDRKCRLGSRLRRNLLTEPPVGI